MIYELLNEGYFDAVKKSSINIEDTKTVLTNKENKIKAEVISDFEKHVLGYYNTENKIRPYPINNLNLGYEFQEIFDYIWSNGKEGNPVITVKDSEFSSSSNTNVVFQISNDVIKKIRKYNILNYTELNIPGTNLTIKPFNVCCTWDPSNYIIQVIPVFGFVLSQDAEQELQDVVEIKNAISSRDFNKEFNKYDPISALTGGILDLKHCKKLTRNRFCQMLIDIIQPYEKSIKEILNILSKEFSTQPIYKDTGVQIPVKCSAEFFFEPGYYFNTSTICEFTYIFHDAFEDDCIDDEIFYEIEIP